MEVPYGTRRGAVSVAGHGDPTVAGELRWGAGCRGLVQVRGRPRRGPSGREPSVARLPYRRDQLCRRAGVVLGMSEGVQRMAAPSLAIGFVVPLELVDQLSTVRVGAQALDE